MRIYKIIALFSALLILIFAGCRSETSDKTNRAAPAAEKQRTADSVCLIIDYGVDRADTFTSMFVMADSVTVLDFLQRISKQHRIDLRIKEYSFGVMIEQIGDRRNGEDGNWVYTVNGESVPAGASAYPVQAGDTIRFFFTQ